MGGGPFEDEVPEWASFFAPAAYRAFLATVEADLTRRGLAFTMGDGVVRFTDDEDASADAEPGAHACGLVNLAQVCRRCDITEWEQIVAHHFDVMLETAEQEHEVFADDFERARGHIKVRLYVDEYLAGVDEAGLLHRAIAPGLVAILTYDMPTHIVTIPAAHAKAWGRSYDELREVALENVRAQDKPSHEVKELADGTPLHALTGDSFFTASHALILSEYVDAGVELGALVSVPHRHAVLFHPLVAIEPAIRAINAMLPIGMGMYREGPGSISPNLYWWRANGDFVHLPAEVRGQQIQFAPPDEFVQRVLNRLAAKNELN